MGKIYKALGLMSGTSMDGVDLSIIETDGKSKYNAILDRYFEYPKDIYKNLIKGAYDRNEKYVKRLSTKKRKPKKYLD